MRFRHGGTRPLRRARSSAPGVRGSEPATRLAGVTKDFGPVHAVRGIDLDIGPGEIVAFLGADGAGETTTIDISHLSCAIGKTGTANRTEAVQIAERSGWL